MMQERKRTQTVVFLADVSVFAEEDAFCVGLAMVPRERRDTLLRMKALADQRRSLGAGLLLEHGLRSLGYSLLEDVQGMTCVHVKKGDFGKPYIAELPESCFNLSHAGNYAAAVFSDCEVGIDIERLRDVKSGLIRRSFCEEEYASLVQRGASEDTKECVDTLTARQKSDFIRLWTRKESYIKAVGEGMHLPLTDFSVLEDVVHGQIDYYLHTWEPAEGYWLSVCAAAPVDVRVIWVDLTKVFDGTTRNNYNKNL